MLATQVLPRRGSAALRDQLDRASASIVLNIAALVLAGLLAYLLRLEGAR